jgi:hypothetical protein
MARWRSPSARVARLCHHRQYDGTVNTFTPSTTLQTKNIQSSTLLQPATADQSALTAPISFITEPNVPAVAVLTNNSSGVYQLTQQLPVPASPINLAGNSNAARVYSITQDNGSNQVAFGIARPFAGHDARPGAVDRDLDRDHLAHPAGWHLPRLWHRFDDNNRVFILNRGSGTVTVINSQFNELDTTPNRQNLNPATGTLLAAAAAGVPAASFNAGPVFADYYAPSSQLVTANYDSNTITIINTSLDQYGNDSRCLARR